jgi:sugar phosphate isomerase/epimerase
MELGMYTLEFSRPTVEALFRDIRAYGFTEVQFDFLSVGDEQMPAAIDGALIRRIRRAADDSGVRIAAVNGTFNMIHPDPLAREDGIRRFRELARHVKALGCDLVTLCTGSRDPHNMWRWHEANGDESAWSDLTKSMERVLAIAEAHGLTLGLEPEASNVMSTAERCRRLLDAFGSPRLKVIMDVANLFQQGQARRENVRPLMRHAFDLLGEHIAVAHGKDIREGEGLAFTHAGGGIVDFPYFKELLNGCGYRGCMLLHGLKREEEFPQSVEFARSALGG